MKDWERNAKLVFPHFPLFINSCRPLSSKTTQFDFQRWKLGPSGFSFFFFFCNSYDKWNEYHAFFCIHPHAKDQFGQFLVLQRCHEMKSVDFPKCLKNFIITLSTIVGSERTAPLTLYTSRTEASKMFTGHPMQLCSPLNPSNIVSSGKLFQSYGFFSKRDHLRLSKLTSKSFYFNYL